MVPVANPYLRSLLSMAIILSLLAVTGCNGCWKQSSQTAEEKKKQEEEEKEKKKKKLPDFEANPPLTMPGIMNDPVFLSQRRKRSQKDPIQKEIEKLISRSRERNFAKPGHWYDVRFQAVANNYDMQGNLRSYPVSGSKPLTIPGTSFSVTTDRAAALPKGEWKTFETSIYFPHAPGQIKSKPFMCEYSAPGVSSGEASSLSMPTMMQQFQHHMVVLTTQPDRYRFIEMTASVQLPLGPNQLGGERNLPHYIVIPSTPKLSPPLPRQSLNWTTIAYVIWDDLDPDELDQNQQSALLDWLHFGGQLIVSGPESLERLENSFLGPYLPATSGKSTNLTNADFSELNQNWSLKETAIKQLKRELIISEKSPLLGVEINPHIDAEFVDGTGELVVERQLGRGRIVATRFSIKANSIKSWRSFDSFFNNVLLRRKPRRFVEKDLDGFEYVWVDDLASMNDPMLVTTVRFLSRDLAGVRGTSQYSPVQSISSRADQQTATNQMYVVGNQLDPVEPEIAVKQTRRQLTDRWHYGGFEAKSNSGLGGWDDFGSVADAARSTLTDAAGIAPPSSTLVLQLLAGYLIVLVPLNWFVFWMVGRVEWAWIAAPIIAILGAIVVIRAASLDIGFTRSNTQVSVLELQSDYPRGHLTEYSALYTSLSTSYQVEQDSQGSQSLPFPSSYVAQEPDSSTPLRITQSNKNVLKGVQIQSNSMQLIHTENMVNVGGAIKLKKLPNGDYELQNDSALELSEVIVVRGRDQRTKACQVARVRSLGAQTKSPVLQFQSFENTTSLTRGIPIYFNPENYAGEVWRKTFGNRGSVTLDMLLGIPEVAEKSDDYKNWFFRQEDFDANEIGLASFINVYQELNPINNVTLGRVIDRVDNALELGTDEFRLYAATDQPIGTTKIVPESTQVDRQTLVVVHLSQPKMGQAKPDANAPSDFGIESTLDRDLRIMDAEDDEEATEDKE
ncbi:MAG: hypothetical protein AAFN77_14935 [Planctomycetota bacterium]